MHKGKTLSKSSVAFNRIEPSSWSDEVVPLGRGGAELRLEAGTSLIIGTAAACSASCAK
jgi:hypothetical protein